MKHLALKRLALVVVCCTAVSALASWSLKGEPSITFIATGNVGLKIEGGTTKVAVKDDGKVVTVTVQLKDLDTGIGLRNRHMAEDMEAAKYPEVSLAVPIEALKVLEDGKSLEGEGKGTLTLHGKSKELPFKYKTVCKAGSCEVDANLGLNLKDFEVKVRSYLGVTVKPEVDIRAKFALAK